METTEEAKNEENMRAARPRSFFTRKLEAKMEERGEQVPQIILSLLDVPFEELTPQEHQTYETQIKPLFHVFSQILLEVFESLGQPEEGWEESTKLLTESPAKVLAMLALYEFRNKSGIPDNPEAAMSAYAAQLQEKPKATGPSPMERRPDPPPEPVSRSKNATKKITLPKSDKSGKWWEKKVF